MSYSTPIENELKIGGEPMIRVGTIENIQDSPEKVAKLLASMGKKSLDFIDDKEHSLLKESYRIEIVPVEHPRWKFQLHIHPIYWFDMLYYKEAKNDEDKKAIIKIAREYVNGVRSSYRPSFPKTSLSPHPSRNYCKYHPTCVSKKKAGPNHHINYIAPDVYCNKGKRSTNCNWYAEDERHVRTMKMKNGDQYIILSRQQHVRNLLISPINHRTNRDLIKDTSFWEWILGDVINKFLLTICKKPYPVECFAINFGKWESESSKDENVVECHAHFHLHIHY